IMTRWTDAIKTGLSGFLLSCLTRFSVILLVAFAAMLLVRYGPGYATDERDLDPTLSVETRNALRNQRLAEGRLIEYAKKLAAGVLSGDLGESKTLGLPVRELIAERGPASLRILIVGSALAWIIGFTWSIGLTLVRVPLLAGTSTILS